MKKGISLIVLVITIIVMIIIAGAIIISLNSSNVISQSGKAVENSDIANLKAALALDYADIMAKNNDPDTQESERYTQTTAKTKYEATAATFTKNTSLKTVTIAVSGTNTQDMRPYVTITTNSGSTVTFQ